MHKVEAIIRPYLLDAAREALEKVAVHDFTVIECRGTGQADIAHRFRGSQYAHGLVPRVMIFTVIPSDSVQEVVEELQKAVCTGDHGDGKIFVSVIEDAIRVRTNERGENAL